MREILAAAGLACILLRPPICCAGSPAAEERRVAAPEVAGARVEEPPPLASDEPIVDLPVEGFAAALVSLPIGATGRRPAAVVAHGNNDGPEQQCPIFPLHRQPRLPICTTANHQNGNRRPRIDRVTPAPARGMLAPP